MLVTDVASTAETLHDLGALTLEGTIICEAGFQGCGAI